MTSLESLDFTKTWILTKYSKFCGNVKEKENWKTIDSSELGAPLIISLTPTNFLEFINLWNGKDNFKGVFKGSCLLVTHKMRDFIRKFRVQFLDCNQKTSQENCNECIEELSHFFKFLPYEETIKTQQATITNQSREIDLSNNKTPLYSESYTSNSLSNRLQYLSTQSSSTNTDPSGHGSSSRFGGSEKSISTNSNNAATSSKRCEEKSGITLNDLTKILLEKNEEKLPLFYQQQSENELLGGTKENDALKEFIVCCLLDPTFPGFVNKIERLFTEIVKNEIK